MLADRVFIFKMTGSIPVPPIAAQNQPLTLDVVDFADTTLDVVSHVSHLESLASLSSSSDPDHNYVFPASSTCYLTPSASLSSDAGCYTFLGEGSGQHAEERKTPRNSHRCSDGWNDDDPGDNFDAYAESVDENSSPMLPPKTFPGEEEAFVLLCGAFSLLSLQSSEDPSLDNEARVRSS